MLGAFNPTPPMSAARAQEIAANFDLRALPPDFYANPYPVYDLLRSTEPVKHMPDGSYFLTCYADLVAVYRDALTFSSDKKVEFAPKYNKDGKDSPLFEHHTSSLVFNDPPLHTRVRKLIMGALTRRAISNMESGLVALVDRLLDDMEVKRGGDLITDYASAIPVEIIGNLLGVPHADRSPLRGWSLAILGALEPVLTPRQQALGNQSVTEFCAYLKDLVAERRKHPGDPEHDVLTRLIQGEAAGKHDSMSPGRATGGRLANGDAGDGQLSEAELLQNCIFILNAGHETTTNLISNSLVALQEWPWAHAELLTQMQRLANDAPALEAFMDTAVDEFLRFESSNQLGNRRARVATSVGGTLLPAGALVTLCLGAANRDPAQFDSPNKLDIHRQENRHLAFGMGIHQCAGLSLARLEGRIAIGRFLARFPGYRLTAQPVRGGRARFRGFLEAGFVAG